MFKKLDDSEKNINKIKEDISILLFKKNEYSNFITSSLFDAQSLIVII
jgi:predicted lactoylglutathione lyase